MSELQSSDRLLLASAGTGKTYRLSAHFVGLLLQGVAPERILATTFTRKAAGEILDRVLQRLVSVALNKKDAEELSKVLGFPVDCASAMGILPGLARSIHRFQVRTLDAHAIHLARLFESELGLPPGWAIADEIADEDLRDEALTVALAEAREEEFMTLLRGLDPTGERRTVFGQLSGTIANLLQVFREGTDEAWECVGIPDGLESGVLDTVLSAMGKVELPQTAKKQPDARWKKALEKIRGFAAEGKWEALLLDGFVGKYSAGDPYYKKPFSDEIAELLDQLISEGCHRFLTDLNTRNVATRVLLKRFQQCYTELKMQSGELRFEDIPYMLDPMGASSPFAEDDGSAMQELWMRLDARIDHLMLDEFQDTSSIQWRTLRPLAEEITATHGGSAAEARTFFCVGDPKQSIYRWRQGEPRILTGLEEEFPSLAVEKLHLNYRSSSVIMEATNRIFESLIASGLFSGDDRHAAAQAALAFEKTFPAHESARVEMGGVVQVWQTQEIQLDNVEEGEPETRQEETLELAARRVAEIHREAPGATIAVLFRTNKNIPKFLHRLTDQFGLRASGHGGNPLVDAEAVSVTMSLLTLADHPRNTAAALHVATSQIGHHLGFTESEFTSEKGGVGRDKKFLAACASLARQVRRDVLEQGYGAWLHALRATVQEHFGEWDRVRFDQLIDRADTFSKQAGLRPSQFARIVFQARVPAPWTARIQAMTVHSSKGLEFDVVLLPELDAKIVGGRPIPVGSSRPDPAGWYESISHLPKKALCEFSGTLQELVEVENRANAQEALNLFYVAITRARRRLEFCIPPYKAASKGGPDGLTFANLLRLTCDVPKEQDPDSEGLLKEWCTEALPWWTGSLDAEICGDADSAIGSGPILLAPSEPGLLHRAPSMVAGPVSGLLGKDLVQNRSTGSARGVLLHRLLEQVRWSEPGQTPSVDPEKVLSVLESDPKLRAAAQADFERVLRDPAMADLFAQPDESAQVWCERRFHLLEQVAEEQVLWSGSIDRLVVKYQGDKPSSAHVIDFKTGGMHATAEAVVETYGQQLRVYGRAVSKQFDLPQALIRLSLAMLDRGEVLDLES
ncbi:MAG: ATP-dependent helicase/nuclease subunit A [Planctomycetota bacterium]|jgi:ATP-dependent helicase/nuclease subunit A